MTDQNKVDDLINQIARKHNVRMNARQSLRMQNLLTHKNHGAISRKSMLWWHPDKVRHLDITVPPGIEIHHAMTYMQGVYAGTAQLRGDNANRLARHQSRVNAAEQAELARKMDVLRLARQAEKKALKEQKIARKLEVLLARKAEKEALQEQFKKTIATAVENAMAPLRKQHQNLKNVHNKLLAKLAQQQQHKARQPPTGQPGSSRNAFSRNPVIDLTVNNTNDGNGKAKRSAGKRPRSQPPERQGINRFGVGRSRVNYKNNSTSSSSSR